MAVCSFSGRPWASLITCHAAIRTAPAPPPSISFPPNANPTPLPSLSCALQCPHFKSCSGCTQEYDLHRPATLDEVTEFFKKHGVSDFTFDSCRLWGWRCRAKLAVRGSPTNPLIGLYQGGTHNIVDIPECKAHHPNINAAVELLKQGIRELNIEPHDEDLGTGELRYVQMAVTTHNTSLPFAVRYRNGKVQVSLVWNSRNENSPSAEKLNALAKYLWRYGGPNSKMHLVHSVWVNFQTSTNNIIFGNRWRHLLGERDFWEHVGGIDVSLTPSSFGQANTRAFDSLLRKLQKYVHYGASVADLYAGAGVIGLSLAVSRKCSSVKCIEINKESKLSFEKTAERLPGAVDSSISWHNADASVEPLFWLVGSDVIVVDPPRKGLDPSLLNVLQSIPSLDGKAKLPGSPSLKAKDEKRPWILRAREASVQIKRKTSMVESQSTPETLIYISCGWESFKKDCMSLLSDKSWHLDKAHGYNFFPGTQSIEVLAVFKRGPAVKPKKKKLGKKNKKKSSQGASLKYKIQMNC
ncbi:23S rRNA (uracil(1939)-C(5))-methyltransferase [Bertholletia excelsa]